MTELPPCTLHQVSEHVWWFTPELRTDRASLALVIGDKETLMLDIGASPAHTKQFLQAVADAGLPEPNSAILSHWHWDHSFGMEALTIPFAAHRDTAKYIERMMAYDYADEGLDELVKQGIEVEFTRECMTIELDDTQRRNLKLRQPGFIFDKMHNYNLGNISCEVLHVGGDHSADSCVMYIPEDKVLFMGDCFYFTVYEEPRHYTSKILGLIEQLETFDAEKFIIGHSNELIELIQIKRWFAIIRQAFDLIEQHGIKNEAMLLDELIKVYGEEDVTDFLNPIIEGMKKQDVING